MKVKEFFENLLHERTFRWYVFAFCSFVASVAFAAYNLVVGVLFRLVWNFSVSFYYLLLMIVKAVILYSEYKWKKCPSAQLKGRRQTLFRVENVFLLMIDSALIAPILLMVLQERKGVNIGMIPTIAMAAYTTYRICMACINYRRSKKTENLALYGLKIISLKEAIVSIITLQNTMVVVFGDAGEMLTLTAWTSLGMFLSMVVISLCQMYKAIKNTPLK